MDDHGEDGTRKTSRDPTDKVIRAVLLDVDKECSKHAGVMHRILLENSCVLLPYNNHKFDITQVQEPFRENFVYDIYEILSVSRAVDLANTIVYHQSTQEKGVPVRCHV